MTMYRTRTHCGIEWRLVVTMSGAVFWQSTDRLATIERGNVVRINGQLVPQRFKTFASAARCASILLRPYRCEGLSFMPQLLNAGGFEWRHADDVISMSADGWHVQGLPDTFATYPAACRSAVRAIQTSVYMARLPDGLEVRCRSKLRQRNAWMAVSGRRPIFVALARCNKFSYWYKCQRVVP